MWNKSKNGSTITLNGKNTHKNDKDDILKINKSNEPDNTINDTANQYLEIYTSSSTSTTTNPPIETITTTTTKYRKQEVNVETLDELKKAIDVANSIVNITKEINLKVY